MMTPQEAVAASPPNVWLTSFYGFDPELWGFLGFSKDGQRKHFVKETMPGALVVIYGHKSKASVEQRGKVIGILQVSHRVNSARAFMHPAEWVNKQEEEKGRWDLAVKAVRAWRIAPESYVNVEEIFTDTYSPKVAQSIGAYPDRLTAQEVERLLDLTWIETTVYGETPIEHAVPASGKQILQPSKPGPVSQTPFMCREAEGPKQIYILKLNGNVDHFLGRSVPGKQIVKVGFSVSPMTRCAAFNAALPTGAFFWEILHSNAQDEFETYATSKIARAGEAAMVSALSKSGNSLGGEFFLADDEAIELAWAAGRRAAVESNGVN